jgi:hypothetical protein
MKKTTKVEKTEKELHTKENIIAETKVAMADYIKGMDAELIGRPLYVVVIGSEGWSTFNTRGNTFVEEDNVDILMSILKDMIEAYKKDYPNL